MAKPKNQVPLTPHDVRVVNRVAELLIAALASMPPLDRVRLAEVLVDRIRTHYKLGTEKPCSKRSSSPP